MNGDKGNEQITKPTLVLLPGPQIEFEDLMEMFEKLTGRPPTEEEHAEALRE
jgi:hypothetical protein